MSNKTISINLLNTLPKVIEWEWFLEEVFTILFFVTGASTNYSIPIPCQTNYEQLKTTASTKVPLSRFWPRCTPVKMSQCSGVIREDLAHLYISVPYIRYCRCRYGLNPGSSRCSHGVTRPYTVLLLSVKDVPQCGMTTVLPGVATVLLGLLGLHSVLIYVSHHGGVIRIGWFQSVPGIK